MENSSDTEVESAPKDFEKGPWLDPSNTSYGRGKRRAALMAEISNIANGFSELEQTKSAFIVLAEDELANYKATMNSPEAKKWQVACRNEYNILTGYNTWTLVDKPPNINLVGSRWTFRVNETISDE